MLRAAFIYPIVIIAFFTCFPVLAGGPIFVSNLGVASGWDNESAIPYHPEDGSCGPFSNTEMLQKLSDDLVFLSGDDEVAITFEQVTGELGQVNVDNYEDFFFVGLGSDVSLLTDDINPIIFDDDGEIIAELAGDENKFTVLGIAGPVTLTVDRSTILDGQAIFNCRCLEDHPSGVCTLPGGQSTVTFDEDDLDGTIVHEMGHVLNLDHSQVNFQLFGNGNSSDDVDIPIMFPFAFDTSADLSLRRDDVVALAAIYPAPDFETDYCVISGTLLDEDGKALNCGDVWIEDGNDANTVGMVSGALSVGTDGNDDSDFIDAKECEINCGYFEVAQLPGPNDLTVTVLPIDEDFIGGSSVGPCFNEQLTTIVKEQIASVTSGQCTANSRIQLGNIITTSTGGTDTSDGGGSNGGGGGGGGPTTIDPDLNPVGYGCSLTRPSSLVLRPSSLGLAEFLFLIVVGFLGVLRKICSLKS